MFCNKIDTIAYPHTINGIAISGSSGCGNTTINTLVAKELGLYGINYTMRSYAKEQGVSLTEISQSAEQDPQIDYIIDRKQVELCQARQNIVLSSRLAIWLLPKATLKVYLYASLELRSQRIQQREGGTLEEQWNRTKLRDQRDEERYRNLYQIDTSHFCFADLIINTETFDQYQTAAIIMQAYRLRQECC